MTVLIPRRLGWTVRCAALVCAAVTVWGWWALLARSHVPGWWALASGIPLLAVSAVLFSSAADRIRFGWITCLAAAGSAAPPLLFHHFVVVSAIWARNGSVYGAKGVLAAVVGAITIASAIRASSYYRPTRVVVGIGLAVAVAGLLLSAGTYVVLYPHADLGE